MSVQLQDIQTTSLSTDKVCVNNSPELTTEGCDDLITCAKKAETTAGGFEFSAVTCISQNEQSLRHYDYISYSAPVLSVFFFLSLRHTHTQPNLWINVVTFAYWHWAICHTQTEGSRPHPNNQI